MQPSGWERNLRTALAAAAFSPAEVARRLDDPPWLKNFVEGTPADPPSMVQYLMISAVTGVTVPVLTGEASPSQSARIALRATERSVSSDGLTAAQSRGVDLIHTARLINSWHADDLRARRARLDSLRSMVSKNKWAMKAGQETAMQVRSRMASLGWLGRSEPITDAVALVESMGVPVEYTNRLPDGVHGLTVHDGTLGTWDGVILVSVNDYWVRQRYTLAHEWGHALFQDLDTTFVNDDQTWNSSHYEETRAESFARHFLAPSRALKERWHKAIKERHGAVRSALCDVMLHFGLSRQAVIIALNDIGIDQQQLRALQQDKSSVKQSMLEAGLSGAWQESCKDQSAPSASPWLAASALNLFAEGRVSAATVARVLGRPEGDVAAELAANGWSPAPAG